MSDVKTALVRAADWLANNRDKHIVGALATDSNGQTLANPSDPKAECFCALGRFAYELGLQVKPDDKKDAMERLNDILLPVLGKTGQEIYPENDRDVASGGKRVGQRRLAGLSGVNALRRLANGL